jgi:hypothetical protein
MKTSIIWIALFTMTATLATAQQRISGESPVGSLSIRPVPKAPPMLVSTSPSFEDTDKNNTMNAAEKGKIRFTLRNEGKGEAYGIATTISLSGYGNTLTYTTPQPIASLAPGASQTIEIPLQTNMDIKTGSANLTISFTEGNGFEPDGFNITIPTEAFKAPQVRIVDYSFSSKEGGKMELGQLERVEKIELGQTVTLRMMVQNTGKGAANNVQLNIGDIENVFPSDKQSFDIGRMNVGESREITYEFFANKRYVGTSIPVKGTLTESYNKYGEAKTMSINIDQQSQTPLDTVIPQIKPEPPVPPRRLLADVDKDLPKAKATNPYAVAVIIGNSNYQQTKPVQFAINDAASIKNYLIETMGYQEGNILYYTDASLSTFKTVFDKNGKLAKTIRPGFSDVFVFYSGHGAPSVNTKKGYFVPIDTDPQYVEQSGYPIDELYANLDGMQAKSITVVLDACFSGADLLQNISPIVVKTDNTQLKNGAVLTSSSDDQVSSWYNENYHGMMTYFFLKAIHKQNADTNKDKRLTAGEIYDYISDKAFGIPYQAGRLHNVTQIPQLFGDREKVIVEYQ